MAAMYAKCPHCEYPVVVPRNERGLTRRCRQCAGKYLPEVVREAENSTDGTTERVSKETKRHRHSTTPPANKSRHHPQV